VKISENREITFTRDLLVQSPSLIVRSNKRKYTLENIQTLYLYPLSIFDYISNLSGQDIIKLTFIELDKNVNYNLFITNLKSLKSVEFIIDNSYLDKIDLLKDLIDLLYKHCIKITLTINNLLEIKDLLKNYYKKINYFKIYMINVINSDDKFEFYKCLCTIANNSLGLLHVKTYLNLNEYLKYEDTVKELKKIGVDIFQVSKELIPLGQQNVDLNSSIEKHIRKLEKKYNKFNTKFISVKDLSLLYYPRFELDERNRRKCYACLMKPYIDGKYIIPCKVNEVISNREKYGTTLYNVEKYKDKVKSICDNCSDCASIFENDTLGIVDDLSKDGHLEMVLL